ncbi:T9SS type A sorting domain-containing protein [Pontibacter sp. Tf4]|uniref:T9SS type A sorting domain-containing protein n=1 Tax=Pontibacter sp. Tf4 TaxID=2761620 RepID=UPI001626582C|nr:T9SS type A sorting domain-containing protein [Pontibacter sp. Tf4]MBB6611504.1 T9SS type A sorting domain-containing protein [Pontibacter sp. Tf4]
MKKLLRAYVTFFALLLLPLAGFSQGLDEPGINSTLDNPGVNVVVNEVVYYDLFVDARDRAGEVMAIRIKLTDPTQRQYITMEYTIDPDRNNPSTAVFSPLTFDEEGIGYIGPKEGAPLKDYSIIIRATFTQAGRYSYHLQLERNDLNIMADNLELIKVSSTTGTDDMIENTRIMAYPTVADGTVNVDLGQVRNADLQVMDMLGRTVYSASKVNGLATINTHQLSKGLYVIKVIKGSDAAALRFIVK